MFLAHGTEYFRPVIQETRELDCGIVTLNEPNNIWKREHLLGAAKTAYLEK